jgi:phosphoribosylanthranilate isomerase
MIRLKVCGMRDAANIKAVAELGPDYMGFIFYEKSPRYVGQDFRIPVANAVGVFVNESTANILGKNVRVVQLHGDETPSQVAELKGKGLTVIKVFSVDDQFDFAQTRDYKADYFMFDTKGKYYGGNAKTFDWKKLEEYDQSTPFFLSGGLNADNLKDLDILKGMNLHAVDVNSGVEDSPGIKNIDNIKRVMSCLK